MMNILARIPVASLLQMLHQWLTTNIENSTAVMLIEAVLAGVGALMVVVVMAVICVYLERKIAAFMQLRIGPNRVGFWGVLQAIADVLKLMMKELLMPKQADKFLYRFGPFLVITVSLLALAPLPFAPNVQMWDINIGILYVTSISSIGVIGILMAGWSSNNKYSLLGAMRSGAQIVSYELSAGLSLITIVVFAGSMQFSEIISSQADGWWIWKGHIPAIISFIVFLIASTAELNRAPFDLAEAESELTAGFHTEFSGMQFAMFFLAEYANMFVASVVGAVMFFGGWMPFHIGGLDGFNHAMDCIPGVVWLFGKIFFFIFMFMWFRWTFPRLRIDQLLQLEWKYLLPLSLVNVFITAFLVLMGWHF